jgi:hypothetical protein
MEHIKFVAIGMYIVQYSFFSILDQICILCPHLHFFIQQFTQISKFECPIAAH